MINKVREHPNNIISKDHLGNEFPTMKDMCEYWGQSYSTVLYRLEHGLSMKEALTMKRRKFGKKVVINKKRYPSYTKACRALGLNVNTFNSYRTKFKMRAEDVINKMLVSKMRREKKKEAQK